MSSHSGILSATISPCPLWRLPPYPSLPPPRRGEEEWEERLTLLKALIFIKSVKYVFR